MTHPRIVCPGCGATVRTRPDGSPRQHQRTWTRGGTRYSEPCDGKAADE